MYKRIDCLLDGYRECKFIHTEKYIMELKNNVTYLFCVFLFLEIQKCIYCLNVIHAPYSCCPTPLRDFTNENLFPNIPNYDSLLISPELDPFSTGQKSFGLTMPSPFPNIDEKDPKALKAYSCSLIQCLDEENTGAVCACNYNTGNVVTFSNKCEARKHNCRFDTNFNVILNEICPWEFESRRTNKEYEVDLTDPKYYN